jgi:hypothetical protein
VSILNLGGNEPPVKNTKKAKKVILGIGLIAAVLGVGSTLASTITLNGNNTREFGQGVERTVFCGGTDAHVQVIPSSVFVNPTEESTTALGSFYLNSITVTNIPRSCSDKDFIISAYGSESSDPLQFADNDSTKLFNAYWVNGCGDSGTTCRTAGKQGAFLSARRDNYQGIDLSTASLTYTDNSFTITINADHASLTTDQLSKIVVETQDDTFGFAKLS